MKIAFNPSTVAALTSPPNNKDITFDLKGHNIFARGVKFYGTDTNTWRDIKVNNVSIGTNILDLRNGSNTTLTNSNGVVTINSTWRPVVDNLTSDSTTSSLSAKQGKVLAGLINGKSDSEHTHDGRYVRAFGTTNDDIDSDWGQSFKTFDPIPSGTPPEKNPNISLLSIGENFNRRKQLAFIYSNDNIYYRRHVNGSFTDWRRLAFANEIPGSLKNPHALTISLNGTSQGPYDGSAAKNINITPGSIGAATSGHNHDDRYLKLTGGTMQLGEGLKFHADENYFGTYSDARIISLLDDNDKVCDGGLIIDERGTLNGKEYVTELLRIRDSEFKWKGSNILHSGNYSSILDSRYYTESEVNSLLSKKLNTSDFNWTSLPGKIVEGNEFNIVNAGFKSGMWFNYLPINNRDSTATVQGYHFGNGAQGYTQLVASGYVKIGSNSSYVLLGDGGHQTISSLSVNYANSSGSATKITVHQHTGNNANYPLVWSNESNTSDVTANQLFKSWADLYYNPKGKRLYTNRYVGNYANLIQTSMRHIEAGLNEVQTDHNLYIGYGTQTYTKNTYIFASTGTEGTDTVTSRSLLAQFNTSAGINLDSNINIRPSIIFRNEASYKTILSYATAGNEALCFETKNSATSIIFYNGATYSESSLHWMDLINGVQIKGNCLAIGAGWANGVNPNYKLKVGGSGYFTEHVIARSDQSNWLGGQRYEQAGYNLQDATDTGSYYPWMRQTNTSSAKWFSIGILNNSFYILGSNTSRTENGYDYGWRFDLSNGWAYGNFSNADTTDGVHLEWSGALETNDYTWLAGWTNDGSKIKAVNKNQFAPASHTHSYYAVNENYGGFKKSERLPTSGFYQSDRSENGGNAPWAGWMHLINCQHSNTTNNYALQIAARFFDNNTFKIRVTDNNVNNAWRDIIHSGNIGSQIVKGAYMTPLTLDVARLISSGYLASDYTSRYDTQEYMKAAAKYLQKNYSDQSVFGTMVPNSQGFFTANIYSNGFNSNGYPEHITIHYYPHGGTIVNCGTAYGSWYYGSINRDGSSYKLQTARNIWGQSFDGTADISGTLSGVANIQFSADNAYDIGSNSNASRYIYTYWLGAKEGQKLELGANNSSFGHGLCINTNLNVGIGTNTPGYKLQVNGDQYATGWSRANNGFYCEGAGVHFSHYGSVGEIAMTSNNELTWGSSTSELYFNFRKISRGNTVTSYIWNAGSSTSWAKHSLGALDLHGDVYWTNGDATMKIYGVDTCCGKENVAFQSTFDGTDPLTSTYVTEYRTRSAILLQPRGGNVGINVSHDPSYALTVGGDTYSSGYVRASSGFIKGSSSDAYVLLGGGGHAAISSLSVSYASNAGNASTLGGTSLGGLFTAFGNNAHNITATIGGVTKSFLVNYAADADKVDGVHVKWAVELTSTAHLVAWESDGSALRDINPANVTVGSANYASSAGNADTVDGYHASQLAKAWSGTSTTMNYVAQNNGNYFGMIAGTGTDGFPNNDGGWTHVFQSSYNNNSGGDGNTGNFWVTQIANRAGTTSPWIRSRSGGSSISTGWTSWVRIMTKNDVDNYYWANNKITTSPKIDAQVRVSSLGAGCLTGIANTVMATNWLRATGNTGIYFQDYAGGLYMSDTTWIRTYNNKALYVNNTIRSTNYQAMYGSTSVSAAKLEGATALIYGTDTSSNSINTYLRGTTVSLQVKKGASINYNALQLTDTYIYCNNYCDMKYGAIVSGGNFTVNNNAYFSQEGLWVKANDQKYYRQPVCIVCGYAYDGPTSQGGDRTQQVECNSAAQITLVDQAGRYRIVFKNIMANKFNREHISLQLTGCPHGVDSRGVSDARGSVSSYGNALSIEVYTSDDNSLNPSSFYFALWAWDYVNTN